MTRTVNTTEADTTEAATPGVATTEADRALKAKHRAMWALGDYPAVASEVVPELGAILVAASGVRSGDRVLDVAAGSGNAAISAALAGASVVASDLTPELFDSGHAQAAERGAEVKWVEADAEPPPLWGDEEHVRALLGDRVTDVMARWQTVTVDRFSGPAQWRDYFKTYYGPTIACTGPSPGTLSGLPPSTPN